jgi:hypothetical protein
MTMSRSTFASASWQTNPRERKRQLARNDCNRAHRNQRLQENEHRLGKRSSALKPPHVAEPREISRGYDIMQRQPRV